MLTEKEFDEHESFRELAALSSTGALSPSECAELKGHLRTCRACSEVYDQYRFLSREGISSLAADYRYPEQESWDDATTRAKLFRRVRATERQSFFGRHLKFLEAGRLRPMALSRQVRAAVVACLIVIVGLGAYRLGRAGIGSVNPPRVPSDNHFHGLSADKKSVDEQFDAQTKKLRRLEQQSSQKERKLDELRSALRTLEDRVNEINAARTMTSEQLRAVSDGRDALSSKVRDAEQSYLNMQADVISLRADRDQGLQRTASLEARIEEFSKVNRDQELKLLKAEQYLSSDRDIRELMGARQLYIADVFDVSSDSRTRKPFGRVFYTQGKSLIFYAFDLDRQPGFKDASTFQAWGRKESEQSKPLNLGILYMDNKANRRWVLRYDDPEVLAEIDAVFVTVEPRGGSQKPSGKPYLYALLRKEVNHP
jgi:hypothetical protein